MNKLGPQAAYSIILSGLLVVLGWLLQSCSPDGSSETSPGVFSTPAIAVVPSDAAPVSFDSTLNVGHVTRWGEVLVDENGMTLYISNYDYPDKSNCDSQCLQTWQPVKADGDPTAGRGVEASLVGVAVIADGARIVTYAHRPLYRYLADKKPGDFGGQDYLNSWFMVSPDGTALEQQEASLLKWIE